MTGHPSSGFGSPSPSSSTSPAPSPEPSPSSSSSSSFSPQRPDFRLDPRPKRKAISATPASHTPRFIDSGLDSLMPHAVRSEDSHDSECCFSFCSILCGLRRPIGSVCRPLGAWRKCIRRLPFNHGSSLPLTNVAQHVTFLILSCFPRAPIIPSSSFTSQAKLIF